MTQLQQQWQKLYFLDLLIVSELTFLGLALIALGTGGIKPCVSSFGGDQFEVPEQEKQLQKFFSLFYAAINSGSLISTILTPILREDVVCLGEKSCYPLAFGVPCVIMVVSIFIFLFGSRWYKNKPPEGNIVVKVSKLVWYANSKSSKEVKREHWLEKADDKYDPQFIEDVKAAFRVLWLYIPLPIFWALFDQQGSRWTFQAARMDGDFGSFDVKPDQMQVVNPVLILAFIPIFELGVYPLLAKCNLLKRPLQRLIAGGILAAVAFIISAGVELKLRETYPVLPIEGEGQLRLYNNLGCDITNLQIETLSDLKMLKDSEMYTAMSVTTPSGQRALEAKWTACGENKEGNITVYDNEATSYFFYAKTEEPFQSRNNNMDKSDTGDPMVMVSYSNGATDWNVTIGIIEPGEKDYSLEFALNTTNSSISSQFEKIISGDGYVLTLNGDTKHAVEELRQGGSYVILVYNEGGNVKQKQFQVTEPNSMNIFWLIPQYVVLTAAEIMFSITGLEFSFTQAPVSMKSLLTSAWLITVAVGNLVVVIVAEAKIFENQAYEFFLFAGLMVVDIAIFTLMAMRYTYVEDLPKKDVELKAQGETKDEDENTKL